MQLNFGATRLLCQAMNLQITTVNCKHISKAMDLKSSSASLLSVVLFLKYCWFKIDQKQKLVAMIPCAVKIKV